MNQLQIANITLQNDANMGDTRKINYLGTFDDNSHIEGFIIIPDSDFQQLSYSQLKTKVESSVIKNLGGTVENG